MARRTEAVRGWFVLMAFVAGAAVAWAQETEPIMTRKRGQRLPFVLTAAVRTGTAPVLDGKLDEACWAQAAVAGEFVLHGGKGYATHETEARVLWDDSRLYIGMRSLDPDVGKLKKEAAGRDGFVFTDDCIEVFLIPPANPFLAKAPESERYFHLGVNALGAAWDGIGYDHSGKWNGGLAAAASIHKDRWEMELSLPWAGLGSKPVDGDVWAINFNRGLPTRGNLSEYSGWSITFAGFHDPDHFGRIIFLGRSPTGGPKSIGPEIQARIVRRSELDPLLDRAASLVDDARAKLRALSARAKLPAITDTLAAVEKATGEAATLRQALTAMAPAEVVATWEALKGRYAQLLLKAEALAAKAGFCAGLSPAQLSGKEPIADFLTFLVPAITNERVLPRRLPTHALKAKTMKLVACPGQYESASFAVYALTDVAAVRLKASALKGPAGVVPASAVDLRVVKVWYQAGRRVSFQNQKVLTPELLLKDDSLVQIDERKKVNILKMDKDAVRDADVLQPFRVPAGTVKQCWVTAHVPAETKAGTYQGTIRVGPATGSTVSIPVELRVLPFELDDAKIICSIYYRAKLGAKTPVCDSETKTEEQLLAEFKDMLAHGLTNPTVYQGLGPNLERYLQLRKQAGLGGGPLMTLGVGVFSPTESLKATIALAKKHGFTDVYFYAADEASGDRLRSQRAAFENVHRAGGKVFVAGYTDSYEIVGDLLDLPIFAHRPDVEMGRAYHAMGHLIGSYANPQGGVEEPETYRRNFGLVLWKAGYDCAMTYAYMHSFGHAWDDWDDGTYRDLNMAYPTTNGVIPTVQWEGYREGYDDLRYLATLQNLIAKTRRLSGPAGEVSRAAHLWMLRIDPVATPLDEIRAGIIERILAIRKATAGAER